MMMIKKMLNLIFNNQINNFKNYQKLCLHNVKDMTYFYNYLKNNNNNLVKAKIK